MMTSFPHTLKKYGLRADVGLLMELYHGMEQGLVSNLGSLFDLGQYLIVKSRREMAPYTLAFWDYFLGIEVGATDTVDEAIFNSAAFEHWLGKKLSSGEVPKDIAAEDLINLFLDDVLKSDLRANVQKELDARELLNKDNPDLQDKVDQMAQRSSEPPKPPETMVDYSQIPLEELMDRMRKVLAQQKTQHRGGNHWVGSHGASPYGHSGAGLHGIRAGGPGYAGSARKVLTSPEFYPVDIDAPLTDDHMDAAIQTLKQVVDKYSETRLDAEQTAEATGRNAGIMVPYFIKETLEITQILLLLDNGGNSMRAHIRKVQKLFNKLKRRFSHDLKTYYFHNAIYDKVYEDEERRKAVSLHKVLDLNPEHKVFIVGDAYMGPHELLSPFGSIEYREESNTPSIENLRALKEHFPHVVWINPIAPDYWSHTLAPYITQLIPMETLSIHGLTNAIRRLTQKRSEL